MARKNINGENYNNYYFPQQALLGISSKGAGLEGRPEHLVQGGRVGVAAGAALVGQHW